MIPIVEAGLVDLVDDGAELAPGLVLTPLPGHTPGQMGLRIDCRDSRAIFCGDAITARRKSSSRVSPPPSVPIANAPQRRETRSWRKRPRTAGSWSRRISAAGAPAKSAGTARASSRSSSTRPSEPALPPRPASRYGAGSCGRSQQERAPVGNDAVSLIARRCERAVVTAYRELRQHGTGDLGAFQACTTLYRIHRPKSSVLRRGDWWRSGSTIIWCAATRGRRRDAIADRRGRYLPRWRDGRWLEMARQRA